MGVSSSGGLGKRRARDKAEHCGAPTQTLWIHGNKRGSPLVMAGAGSILVTRLFGRGNGKRQSLTLPIGLFLQPSAAARLNLMFSQPGASIWQQQRNKPRADALRIVLALLVDRSMKYGTNPRRPGLPPPT